MSTLGHGLILSRTPVGLVILQEAGLTFCRNIADIDEGRSAILAGGRVGLAVAAIKGHPESEGVLDAALGLLQIVAISDDGQNVLLGGRSVQVL